MEIEYNPVKYRDAMFIETVKNQPDYEILNFELKVLSEPKVQIIPSQANLQGHILHDPKCTIGFEESVTVLSTALSYEFKLEQNDTGTTGLSLPLHQGQSIVLGRGKLLNISMQHVSRQQLEISSKGSQVMAIRRGTNRSLLNGQELIKDTPTALKNGDSITLLEKDYQIIVEIPDTIHPLISSTATPTGPAAAHPQILTTPEIPTSTSRKDGPPEKKIKLETPVPLLDKQALETIKDWKAIHTDTVRREAIQRNTENNEDTSDSEAEAHNRSIREENLNDNQSDISAESSFICSDLSDLEPERPVQSEWTAVHGKGHIKHE
ncbi:hypothetical protein BGZ82_004799 [Podila clonocystis]|nr:hypothetical protein BGZ82_004799 [Podila clonocystis]